MIFATSFIAVCESLKFNDVQFWWCLEPAAPEINDKLSTFTLLLGSSLFLKAIWPARVCQYSIKESSELLLECSPHNDFKARAKTTN